MGFLNWFIKSVEEVAKDAEYHVDAYLPIWRAYLVTIPKKEKIVFSLKTDSLLSDNLQELKRLLGIELADINSEEKIEEELIKDIESLDHITRIKEIKKLDVCLGYAKTKYEYVYNLLVKLHEILTTEMQILEKLLSKPKEQDKLILHLGLQLNLELEIIEKIKEIKTFNKLFSELVRGEETIKVLNAKEKRLYKKMAYFLDKAVSQELEIPRKIMISWIHEIFDAIRIKVEELIADETLDQHHDSDFEYVNRPEFESLVKETITHLRKKPVSEEMINAVVKLCREEYNGKYN